MADTNTYTSKQKIEKWTSRDKFKALDLTDVPIGTEYNLTGNIELEDLDSSLQTSVKTVNGKTGGTITGNVTITGDLTVNGTEHINNVENLDVENQMIYTNSSGTAFVGNGGIGIKTNTTDVYGIVYDTTSDSVKLGLGTSDSDGKFTFNTGEGEPVAIRDDSSKLIGEDLISWDAEGNKLVDSGIKKDNVVVKDNLKDYYELTGGQAVSDDSINLNTFTIAGTYNLSANTMTNIPPSFISGAPITLHVEYIHNGDYVVQTCRSITQTGQQHMRSYSASVWTDWVEIATDVYIDRKVAVVEFVQPVDKDNLTNTLALTDEQYRKLLNTETAFIVYGNDIYRKNVSGDDYNGMMFESVSGIFDYSADLYLTTAYMSDDDYTAQKISVGSVDGLSLGLPVSFYTPSNVAIEGLSNRRITSIDSTNKKITVDGGFIGSSLRLAEGSLLKVPTTSPSKKLTNTIITGDDETNIINVDETRSLTVGMAISFHVSSGGLMAGAVGRVITAINDVNKTITISGAALDSDMVSKGTYITLYQTKPTKGKLKVLYPNSNASAGYRWLSFSEINIEEPKDALSVTLYEAGD